MRRIYIYRCPKCGKEYTTTNRSFLKYKRIDLADHILENHRDYISEWFAKNRRKFLYVRRKIAKFYLEGRVMGWFGGIPIRVENKELGEEVRVCDNITEIIKVLEEHANRLEKFRKEAPEIFREVFPEAFQTRIFIREIAVITVPDPIVEYRDVRG